MTHDLLDHLADVEIGTRTPDLASVERRSHAIIRRRRAVRVGAVGLSAVMAFTISAILPPGTQSTAPLAQVQGPLPFGALPAAAGTNDPSCGVGFTSMVARSSWASAPGIVESAALIADPPFPLTRLEVVQDDVNCPEAVPAAVLYDLDPVRGISVWSDVQDPFTGIEDVPDEAPLSRVTVGGRDARLRDLDRSLQLSWLAPDGTRWMAMSSGLTAQETLGVLDRLTFDGSTLDPSSVPGDLTSAPVSTVRPTAGVTTWQAWYNEEADQPAVDPPVTHLTATTAFTPPIEVVASMDAPGTAFFDVGGHPAVFTTNGADLATATFGWLHWARDGVSYTLVSWGTVDEIVALAQQVEHVSLDDPRVTAVAGH